VSGCPNSTEGGCRCPEHAPGLSAFARDPAAFERALAPCRPTTLHVVTLPSREVPCTGTMTCSCRKCVEERSTRAPVGGGGGEFKVRPPRHLRAA
jgi:hypothetical protein